MITLFPFWLLALTGLSTGLSGATQSLSWVQAPCCWAALDMSSPAHIQRTQYVNMGTNPASHQTCLGLARAAPAAQDSLNGQARCGLGLTSTWQCGHLAVSILEQLIDTEHRIKTWPVTVTSAHCYWLPCAAWTSTTASMGQALVLSRMSSLQVGRGGHLAMWKVHSLPWFVSCSCGSR